MVVPNPMILFSLNTWQGKICRFVVSLLGRYAQQTIKIHPIKLFKKDACTLSKTPGDGFEPPLKEPESFVLPLDDPGITNILNAILTFEN